MQESAEDFMHSDAGRSLAIWIGCTVLALCVTLAGCVVCLVIKVRSLSKRARERELIERTRRLQYGTELGGMPSTSKDRSPKSHFRRLIPHITFPVPGQTPERSPYTSSEMLVTKPSKKKLKKQKSHHGSDLHFSESHYNGGSGAQSDSSTMVQPLPGAQFGYEFLNLPRNESPTSSISGASTLSGASNGGPGGQTVPALPADVYGGVMRPSTSTDQDTKSVPDNVSWWLTLDESDAAPQPRFNLDDFQMTETSDSNGTSSGTTVLPPHSMPAGRESHEVPLIEFKLYFSSVTSRLTVGVQRVSNLPAQFRANCSSFVKVSLLTYGGTKRPASFMTQVVKGSLNPEYFEDTEFSGYNFQELKSFTVRFVVYCRRKSAVLAGKQRVRVGDLCVPLFRPDLDPDRELVCRERISLACLQTGKRVSRKMYVQCDQC